MDGHMGRVFSLKYHPSDTRMLVSAGWDDTVQFWDTRSKHSVRYTTRAGRRGGRMGGEGREEGRGGNCGKGSSYGCLMHS